MAIGYDNFENVDIRVGTIRRAEPFPEANRPAIKQWVDFGPAIGEKKTSAQITRYYEPDALISRQVAAVVNFPPNRSARSCPKFWCWGFPMKTMRWC